MKKIIIIIIAVVVAFFASKGCSNNNDITGYSGRVKNVKGNILTLVSGLSVRMIGVKDNATQVEMFVKNNFIGKQIHLVADSHDKKTFKTNSETVNAYVDLADGRCINHMIVNEYPETYDGLLVRDSLGWDKDEMPKKLENLALFMKERTFLITIPVPNGTKFGTGFFINDEGLAVTNFHVLSPDEQSTATVSMYPEDPNLSTIDEKHSYGINDIVWYEDTLGYDLCIFHVALPKNMKSPHFKLAKKHARQQDEIGIYGNPEGLIASYASGSVGAYRTMQKPRRQVTFAQLDANVNQGNSGGPICDKYGRIIAIVDWGIPNTQGLNFGIDALELRKVLDEINAKYDRH